MPRGQRHVQDQHPHKNIEKKKSPHSYRHSPKSPTSHHWIEGDEEKSIQKPSEKPYEELYSWGLEYSKKIKSHKVPDDILRAHIFPKAAYHQLLDKKGIKRDKDVVASEVPYIVVPKLLERVINDEVVVYARIASETGKVSSITTKKDTTYAIGHDSEFALQHPAIYRHIFVDRLIEYANSLGEDAREKLLASLVKAQEILDAQIEKDGLGGQFSIQASKRRSRTLSDDLVKKMIEENDKRPKNKTALRVLNKKWEEQVSEPFDPKRIYETREALEAPSIELYQKFRNSREPIQDLMVKKENEIEDRKQAKNVMTTPSSDIEVTELKPMPASAVIGSISR